MDTQERRHIVIVGGGIIGCTTAYYITRHPKFNPALHTVTLLEATEIAAGASGKAGGLLALWAYPDCLVPLSYRLHKELAAEHDGEKKWGYRRGLGCGSVYAVVKAADLKERKRKRVPTPPSRPNNDDGNGKLSLESVAQLEEKGKYWEKLPKQDEAAAKLLKDSPLPPDLDWIEGRLVTHYEEMGTPGVTETAQVHPRYFTQTIAELAKQAGVDIREGAKVMKIGEVESESEGEENAEGQTNTKGTIAKGKRVQSVEYEDRATNEIRTIDDVTDVVVTAGPWTGKLLPQTQIGNIRAHSVVFEADVSPYAVFTSIQLPAKWVPEHMAARGERRRHGRHVDPEVYARPGKEVYACGETDNDVPLPPTAEEVETDLSRCEDIIAYIGTISPQLASAPVKTRQACYLPLHKRDGEETGPLIGPMATKGLWVAAGHSCWGIQNGPGTGYLMARMLFGDEVDESVAQLGPKKYNI